MGDGFTAVEARAAVHTVIVGNTIVVHVFIGDKADTVKDRWVTLLDAEHTVNGNKVAKPTSVSVESFAASDGGSGSVIIIIIIVVLLIIAAAAGAAYYFLVHQKQGKRVAEGGAAYDNSASA